MGRKPREPGNLTLDPVTAYARRGPKEGRWYWQAIRREGGKQITVWTGWGRAQDIQTRSPAHDRQSERDLAALPTSSARPDLACCLSNAPVRPACREALIRRRTSAPGSAVRE